jgi:GMP synthase-like glutamine amidotransferase
MKHTEKIIRVFQHDGCGGMGYLATFLDARRVPYEMIRIDQQQTLPRDILDSAGLIFLGSNLSVNSGHPWIAAEIELIRQAAAIDLPVLGICFGGQLISKALGGHISKAPNLQIGWFRVESTAEASTLIDTQLPSSFEVFEWHEDTFSVPAGGIPLFYGECVKQQGFLHGRCLALQFHLEITRHKIQDCLIHARNRVADSSACVHPSEQMLQDLDDRISRLHAVSDTLFQWWLNLGDKEKK